MCNTSDAKDAIIAEYSRLGMEIRERSNTQQKTVISWLLVLTGGLIGIFLQVDIPGMNMTIVSAFSQNKITPDFMMFLSALMIGYVLAVELLIAYSLYQLYMAFRLSDYILRLDTRIKDILGFTKNYPLFGWDRESRGMADIDLDEVDEKAKNKVKASLKIASWLELVTPFTMAFLGLLALAYFTWTSHNKGYDFLTSILLGSIILFGLGLIILRFVDKYLHYWLIRTGGKRSQRLDERKRNQEERKS